MKNKLFVLTLLTSFALTQAESPLSPEERTHLLKEHKNKVMCYAILYNLKGAKILNTQENLTLEEQQKLKILVSELDKALPMFKCEEHRAAIFASFDIDVAINKIDKQNILNFSIEEIEKAKQIEQKFLKLLKDRQYEQYTLAKRLGLSLKELDELEEHYLNELWSTIPNPTK